MIVALQNGTGYVLGAASAATMRIIDNTIPPPRPAPVFDLDVNANGSLDDAVDLAANYLPGYEGTTQKVSTGTNFNSDVYQGQRMKLILDGIGSDTSEVKRIEFEITDVTQYAGYASNRSFTTNVGVDDYSFYWGQDSQDPNQGNKRIITIDRNSNEIVGPNPSGGHMDASRTWVNFYAKDYGGWAKIVVRVYTDSAPGAEPSRVISLTVPKDTDNDKLADKWEIAMATRWTNQYALQDVSDDDALKMFNPSSGGWFWPIQDDELKDPDGSAVFGGNETRPLVPQKDTGDGHNIVEEYRGYILDGGGFDGTGNNGFTGGHIRLDPARKEILVEVDKDAQLTKVPNNDLPAILAGASKVFSQADRGAGIFMYYLFDEVDLAPPWDANQQPSDAQFQAALANTRDTTAARDSMTTNLKSDFLHVRFIDTMKDVAGAETNDSKGDVGSRGVIFATSTVDDRYSPPLKAWVTTPAKKAEAFSTVLAHELTHLLIKPGKNVGVWDGEEHQTNPMNSADLMYAPSNADNRQLATVKFSTDTQKEIWTKSPDGLV